MANGQKREIAHKVRITDIQQGEYVKEDREWKPSYVVIGALKVSRVNIIGTVVLKEEGGNSVRVWLDDSSDKIGLRTFENSLLLKDISIGDVVNVIGRPYEFGKEKYIFPESVKKISPDWLKVRNLELGPVPKAKQEMPVLREPLKKPEPTTENVFDIIKRIDKGEGADFEQVISTSSDTNAEKIIKRLLEEGEVFEVRPGKLKVLE